MHNYFNGRGTFGFTCDVCGRELNSCSIVNGMKFCAKCYQETFGKDTQQNEIQLREQIQQLKQQLEEKQNKIDEISKEFVQAVHAVYDWRVLCAEKDKEIEDWKQKTQTFLNRVNEQNYEIANNNPKQLAIQELEKVKTLIQNAINFEKPNFVEVYDAINKQIKELKKEKAYL